MSDTYPDGTLHSEDSRYNYSRVINFVNKIKRESPNVDPNKVILKVVEPRYKTIKIGDHEYTKFWAHSNV